MSAVAHIDEYKTGFFNSDEYRGAMSWNGWEANNLMRNEGPGADGGTGPPRIDRLEETTAPLGSGIPAEPPAAVAPQDPAPEVVVYTTPGCGW